MYKTYKGFGLFNLFVRFLREYLLFLQIWIVHCNRHFGNKDICFLFVIPLIISSSESFSLISVANAKVVFPSILSAVPFHSLAFSHAFLVIIFITMLPVNVSCCICFRVLYSRWEKSEYIAVLSCLVWVGLWMMIVANDVIYQKIVTPVWVAMLILTFVYFIFCVQKSLVFDEKILEDYTYEIRI